MPWGKLSSCLTKLFLRYWQTLWRGGTECMVSYTLLCDMIARFLRKTEFLTNYVDGWFWTTLYDFDITFYNVVPMTNPLKLLSYNCREFNNPIKLKRVSNMLTKERPRVVPLQETHQKHVLPKILKSLGLNIISRPQGLLRPEDQPLSFLRIYSCRTHRYLNIQGTDIYF